MDERNLPQENPEDIRGRLARWRRSRDLADLWPFYTPDGFRRAQAEIARVSSLALQPSVGLVRLDLPERVDARLLGVAAFASGMGPLLGYWIEHGSVEAGPAVRDVLTLHLDHGRRRANRMLAELRRVISDLQGHGVEPVVLKGGHTGSSYFPEAGCRPLADIDILIPPAEWDRAAGCMTQLGYAVSNDLGLPYRTEWMPTEMASLPRSLEMTHSDNPFAIDVHRSLDRAFFGQRPAGFGAPERDQTEATVIADTEVLVLRQPLCLSYLAFHTASHLANTPLVRLVELLLVARQDYTTAGTWSSLERFLARTGSAGLVYPALSLADRLVRGVIDESALCRIRAMVPSRMRRAVDRMEPATLQRMSETSIDVRLMWPMSPRDVLSVVRSIIWPAGLSPARMVGLHVARIRRLLNGSIALRWRA